MTKDDDKEKVLAAFHGKKIRRTWHNDEWWFVAEDIVDALTDSGGFKQQVTTKPSKCSHPKPKTILQTFRNNPLDSENHCVIF